MVELSAVLEPTSHKYFFEIIYVSPVKGIAALPFQNPSGESRRFAMQFAPPTSSLLDPSASGLHFLRCLLSRAELVGASSIVPFRHVVIQTLEMLPEGLADEFRPAWHRVSLLSQVEHIASVLLAERELDAVRLADLTVPCRPDGQQRFLISNMLP